MTAAPSHVVVVGGTGMLSGLSIRLSQDRWRVSVLARHATDFARRQAHDRILGFDCDYGSADALDRALACVSARANSVRLAVAWIHSTAPAAARRVAEQFAGTGSPFRFLHVLGSAVADPAQPDRLAAWRERVTRGLSHIDYAQAVLGFVAENGRSRWLTDAEICAGVYEAARSARALSIVGTVTPWSARP